jgi:hypothetical protein
MFADAHDEDVVVDACALSFPPRPSIAASCDYFAYNFIKIHRTLRVTPAMAAKVTDRLFDVSDIVALLEAAESKKAA